MKISKSVFYLKSVTAALLLVAVGAYGSDDKSNGKKFTFTTKSKEAKQYVEQAIRSIESFQGGPQLLTPAQRAVEADPEFAFAHYLVGTATPPPANQPHIDKAVELAKKASDGERRYIEAVLLTRAQKLDEAAKIFMELSEQYPEERMVRMLLGQVYIAQGKLSEAKASFEKAIHIDGSTPRAYGFVGNIQLLKGEYGKARETFKSCIAKATEGVAPFLPNYGMAYAYLYEGNYESALKVLKNYEVEYTKTGGPQGFPAVFIWNSIARVYLESGDAKTAIEYYKKGYETVKESSIPDDQKQIWYGRLHHGTGRALAKMGKHAEAWKEAELIKKMIDEGGEQGKQFIPAYHYLAGYVRLENKEYDKAIEHLKQSDQTDPFQQLLLARAYEKSGDKANAQETYKKITASTQVTIERALAYSEAKKKVKG